MRLGIALCIDLQTQFVCFFGCVLFLLLVCHGVCSLNVNCFIRGLSDRSLNQADSRNKATPSYLIDLERDLSRGAVQHPG